MFKNKLNIDESLIELNLLKYPDLTKLILNTSSISNFDKEYLLLELDNISEQHKQRLFDILENERVKLLEIINNAFKDNLFIVGSID